MIIYLYKVTTEKKCMTDDYSITGVTFPNDPVQLYFNHIKSRGLCLCVVQCINLCLGYITLALPTPVHPGD